MPLAEWSGKTAIENQNYMFDAAKFGQFYRFAPKISQSEVGGRGA
jgi:hypothetical protein